MKACERFGTYVATGLLALALTLCLHISTALAQTPTVGTFTPTGSMTTARRGHTATLLLDGKVLVVGGNSGSIASAELYDPHTGNFSATGSVIQALGNHRATLLQDGRTLITGESGHAELYNPVTGTFTVTGNMIAARPNHTATILLSGKVLVTGSASVAELYDPQTGTFTTTGSTTDSSIAAAVLLLDGRVLRSGFSATEIYDPVTGTFSVVGPSISIYYGDFLQDFSSTLLPSGSVLFTGGWNPFNCETVASPVSVLFAPETGKLQPTDSMSVTRAFHTATLLPGGTVLVAGGFSQIRPQDPHVDNRSAEIYLPDSRRFQPTGSMLYPRSDHTATLLNDGRVLVAGGGSTATQVTAEIYTPDVLGNAQVTVQTAPAGLQIAVDGTMFTAPQTFSWSPGTNHSIATASPQGGAGTRHVFANWNDMGAISHIVAPMVNTTYSATFTTQHLLTTDVSPASSGTIALTPSSADGYYESGTSVQLSAFANSGYAFSSWSGAVTGSANPILSVMSGPKNVVASFNLVHPTGLSFVPVIPCRVADTRNPSGPLAGPVMAANSTRNFTIPTSNCGIPSTALAYSLNVTVVPTTGTLGYLSIWPAGQPQPLVSTLNSTDGRVKANAAIVGAGTGGAVSVFVFNESHVILDINGYFPLPASAPGGLVFYPVSPCRVIDTHLPISPLGGPILTGGASRTVPMLSSMCGLPGTAAAYSLNVTVLPTGTLDYLTTWPTGIAQPLVSTLNDSIGTVVANAAIVPAGTGGAIDVFVPEQTHLIIDVNGYFAPPTAGGLLFYSATPCRLVDTRNPPGPFGGPALLGQRDYFNITAGPCALPAGAQAYSLNATVVPYGFLNYLTLWPTGQPQPFVSTLNSYDASIVSNMAIVSTTSAAISAFSTGTTDLILDLNGFFAP